MQGSWKWGSRNQNNNGNMLEKAPSLATSEPPSFRKDFMGNNILYNLVDLAFNSVSNFIPF